MTKKKMQVKKETLNPKLLSAVDSDEVSSVQQLVTAGADINCVRGGKTPVMWAISHNNNKVANWLLSAHNININNNVHRTDGTTLHMACEKSTSEEIVSTVARLSENVNVKHKGVTPLQVAVEEGNGAAVLGLLPVIGVDWEVKDDQGHSLLDIARYNTLCVC